MCLSKGIHARVQPLLLSSKKKKRKKKVEKRKRTEAKELQKNAFFVQSQQIKQRYLSGDCSILERHFFCILARVILCVFVF